MHKKNLKVQDFCCKDISCDAVDLCECQGLCTCEDFIDTTELVSCQDCSCDEEN